MNGDGVAPLLIRGAYLLTLDERETVYPQGDVLVEGDSISAIGASIPAPIGTRVIDGRGRLAMPGLINAHMHSDETLFRGLLDNMPLEVWMLYSLPPLDYGPISPRLIYLRTLLGAIEMLQNGITTVQDDVSEAPRPTLEGSEAILQAYLDAGMRASVACNMTDKAYADKLPYARDELPEFAKTPEGTLAPANREDLLALCRTLLDRWHGRDGRLQIALSASAPQRCTDEFIVALDDLSRRRRRPLLSHVLETKVQNVTAREFYGRTIVEHLHDLGVLSDRLTIAHGIWLTDRDLHLLAASGTAIAHNPVSNLKLGSGLFPFHAARRAGIPICLGTDGSSSNDAFDMFEVMKAAALLHKISSPLTETWPTARDVLHAALRGGARSTLLQDHVGMLAPGRKADMVLMRLDTPAFVPFHRPENHLVYCNPQRSVETVIIGGRVVVEHGQVTTVNAPDVYAEVGEAMRAFMAVAEHAYGRSQQIEPAIRRIYLRSQHEDVGINRFATSPEAWGWTGKV